MSDLVARGVKEGRDGQIDPPLSLHRSDLTASTGDIRVEVKGLPEMIERFRSWLRTDVDEDDDVGLKLRCECFESPAMRVELFGVLLLQAEHELALSQRVSSVPSAR